jgi:hypothetical protein
VPSVTGFTTKARSRRQLPSRPLGPSSHEVALAKKHNLTLADPSLLPTVFRLQLEELRKREDALRTT